MIKKIAILRGVNVGGKRKMLMADLRKVCEELGWQNVKTYIQSGNLIFDAEGEYSDLESSLEKAIINAFGFDVPVIIRDAGELQALVLNSPFYTAEAEISTLHLTFLKEKPSPESTTELQKYDFEPDKFILDNKDVFVFCAGKYHRSKLSNNFFEKKLKTGATTRNWKTVLKLLELSKA